MSAGRPGPGASRGPEVPWTGAPAPEPRRPPPEAPPQGYTLRAWEGLLGRAPNARNLGASPWTAARRGALERLLYPGADGRGEGRGAVGQGSRDRARAGAVPGLGLEWQALAPAAGPSRERGGGGLDVTKQIGDGLAKRV